MKLSEKGKENLQGFGFAFDCDGAMALLDDYEFEPDDFQGAVMLTVEEAKQLQEDFLDIVCEIVRLVGRYGVKYEKPDSLIILEGRIEQTEEGK